MLLVAMSVLLASPSIIEGEEYASHRFDRHLALGMSPEFRSVGAFRNGCTGGGVWLGDRFVLTTAHSVVDRAKLGYRNVDWYEWVLVDSQGREHSFHIKRFYVTKAYFESVGRDDVWGHWGSDIAIAELDRKPNVSGVSPAILGYDAPPKGEVLTLVSYGMRGTTSEGTLDSFGSGFKDRPPRPFGSRVAVSGVDTMSHHISLTYRKNSRIELQGVTSSCDSGGGAFMKVNGEWRLVGTISTSQLPTLNGPMQQDSMLMGLTALGPYTRMLFTSMRSGDWSAFEFYDPPLH